MTVLSLSLLRNKGVLGSRHIGEQCYRVFCTSAKNQSYLLILNSKSCDYRKAVECLWLSTGYVQFRSSNSVVVVC